MKTATCKERWVDEKSSTIEDIRTLFRLWQDDPDASDDDLGNLYEYGLSFEKVESDNPKEGDYWRWQLSCGGPSSEFRFWTNHDGSAGCVEFWFLDWFDGHGEELGSADLELMEEVWDALFREGIEA